MGKVRKVLRILKWSGVAWCLLLVVAWPVSVGRYISYRGDFGGFVLMSGTVGIVGKAPDHGFFWHTFRSSRYLVNWWGDAFFDSSTPFTIAAPVWVVLLISIPLTYLLFRLDRRKWHPPGHCQSCGYDLTGNVTGKCSECGTETEGQ